MKLASCSSFSTVTPTPLYTSSLSLPAGQYCTHITRIKSNVLWVKNRDTYLLPLYFQVSTIIKITKAKISPAFFVLCNWKTYLVTMTMHEARSCHTIRQKSPMDVSVGPCVTM